MIVVYVEVALVLPGRVAHVHVHSVIWPRGSRVRVLGQRCGLCLIDYTHLVMEWKSGQDLEYSTSSLDFHPNITPFRENPERSIGHQPMGRPSTSLR